MAAAGYRVDAHPRDGDELMAELADDLTYGGRPGPRRRGRAGPLVGRRLRGVVRRRSPRTPAPMSRRRWGPAPGEVFVSRPAASGLGDLVFSGMDLGGVLVAVQPPRGFGENPVAVYHSPDLAPTHHYLAFYRWLDEEWGAARGRPRGQARDARVAARQGRRPVVVVLPRRGLGRRAARLPLRGQRPRRGHPGQAAHPRGDRRPPGAAAHPGRARRRSGPLEGAARPARAAGRPRSRQAAGHPPARSGSRSSTPRSTATWGCTGEDRRPPGFDDPAFDDLLLEVDGYLCELKDAQIRGGLHVLGRPPRDVAELDMVAAITRLPQAAVGSLRQAVAEALGRRPRARRAAAGRGRRRRGRVPAPARGVPAGRLGRGGARPRRATRAASSCAGCAGPSCRRCAAPTPRCAPCWPPSTAGSWRPGPRARRLAAWPTCCRPAATSTRSTRRRSRRRWPGTSAAPWPTA